MSARSAGADPTEAGPAPSVLAESKETSEQERYQDKRGEGGNGVQGIKITQDSSIKEDRCFTCGWRVDRVANGVPRDVPIETPEDHLREKPDHDVWERETIIRTFEPVEDDKTVAEVEADDE
jgi:hypothetical protein